MCTSYSSSGQLQRFTTAACLQVQLPGPVATSMVRAGTPESCFNPRPGVFVGHAGRHIGYETVCFPYPPHAMIMCATTATLLRHWMPVASWRCAAGAGPRAVSVLPGACAWGALAWPYQDPYASCGTSLRFE